MTDLEIEAASDCPDIRNLGFEESPIAIFITRVEGSIVDANLAFCNLVGYSLEELIGMGPRDLSPKEDWAASMEASAMARRDLGSSALLQKTYIRKDGRRVQARVALRCLSRRDPSLGMVGACKELSAEDDNRSAWVQRQALPDFSFWSDICFFEMDISETRNIFAEWRAKGVTDVGAYLKDREDEFKRVFEVNQVVQANEAALRVFEASNAEDLRFLTSRSLDSRDTLVSQLQALFDGGRSFEMEREYLTFGGKRIILRFKAEVVGGGDPGDRVLIHAMDITDRVELQENLEATKLRLELALDNTDLGVWDVDINSGELNCSENLLQMLGYSPSDFGPGVMLQRHLFSLIHPDDLEPTLKAFRRHLRGEQSCFEIQHRVKAADGEWRWCRARGAKAVQADQDQQPRVIGTWKDITAEKKAELVIALENQVLERAAGDGDARAAMELLAAGAGQIIEDAHCVILGVDSESLKVLFCASSKLQQELESEFCKRTLGPKNGVSGAAIDSGRPVYVPDISDSELFRERSAWFHQHGISSARAFPLFSPRGEISGAFCVLQSSARKVSQIELDAIKRVNYVAGLLLERDRHEREHQKIQTQMLSAQKLEGLGVLAGGIAHDFNNLLMAILANAEMIRFAGNPDACHHAEQIERASLRAGDLCRQMLAYAGKGKMTHEAVNVGKVSAEMVRLLAASISKKINVRLSSDKSLLICGDESLVSQLVLNLLTNAAEAVGEQVGRLYLETREVEATMEMLKAFHGNRLKPGRYVQISCSDDGSGMSAETREKIFDPFFSTKADGRGLGLASVYGIVQQHEGAVAVESELGEGTTLRILIPIMEGAPCTNSASVIPEVHVNPRQGVKRVLLVDDEEVVRTSLASLLTTNGYEVLAAESGDVAIKSLSTDSIGIDVVLLDQSMPGLDGFETGRKLRGLQPSLPILMMSGHAQPLGQGKPFDRFMHKPFKQTELLGVLQELLESPAPQER